MIVTTDIYTILHEKVQEFGIKAIYDSWNPITSELKEKAIVIVTSTPIEPDTYWEKTFVHVNICVPDYLNDVDTVKLNEVERLANMWIYDEFVDEYDDSWYRISRNSLGIERDDRLQCSYVSIKLLFEILNVR